MARRIPIGRFGEVLAAAVVVSAWAVALEMSGCRGGSSGQEKQLPVPVLAAVVEKRDVPVQVFNIGTVEAYSTVSVKSLVGGALMKVHIKEGQEVKKGQALFTIDPRPIQAALNQAEANLGRDTVQYESAVRNAKRVETLYKQNVSSQDELDTAQTAADSLAAAIKADKATIEMATIQLGYCQIESPVDGVAGELLVNEGNIVKANDVALITLNQVQPIYVSFSVPQQHLPEIRRYQDEGPLKIDVATVKEVQHLATGELAFIDNTIDLATGTIQLKGVFANEDRKLWPGQFVNVALTLTVDRGASVVPSRAIQTGQEGQFVYVIKDDMTVVYQKVTVERIFDGNAVVTGLQPGQQIVTDGQLKLSPGAKVEIKPALISPAAASQGASAV
jgi:multidrug efflux system membrane fusion protein